MYILYTTHCLYMCSYMYMTLLYIAQYILLAYTYTCTCMYTTCITQSIYMYMCCYMHAMYMCTTIQYTIHTVHVHVAYPCICI